nr:lytic murein transglycosylase [Shewanella pealeana]
MSFLSSTAMAESETQGTFSNYVAELKQDAIDKGFSQQTIDEVFPKIKMFKKALVSNKDPIEDPITLETYLPQIVPQTKVDLARAFYKQHYTELEKIGERYGVQPRFIVALLGIESNLGQDAGGYPVLSVTASLAYQGQREAHFRQEFFAALKIVDQGHIDFSELKGTSTGTMGQPLFLPSIYLAYAQDGDGDGRKDIWSNNSDVFASAAYYLQQAGWKATETWGRQVKVPNQFQSSLADLSIKKSFNEWQALGVRRFDGSDLPKREDMQISMVMPDGIAGRSYLIYDNYRGLLQWNNSDYFAISVTYLSERIKYPPII